MFVDVDDFTKCGMYFLAAKAQTLSHSQVVHTVFYEKGAVKKTFSCSSTLTVKFHKTCFMSSRDHAEKRLS